MDISVIDTSKERWIELGGGNNPRLRPNADVRAGPAVDVVVDFNKPLPMASNQFDGVLSVYAIEHVSWRAVDQFIREVHRILKPGGRCVLVTANLEAQCKKAAQEGITKDNVCMIFGDLDYPENGHKCGFSPASAQAQFKQAGFYSVECAALPECATDMVIEARKSAAHIAHGA